jgi:MFS family permease
MFDTFEEKERRFISGLQFSFVAGGCIFLSVVGGLLTRLIWYGGYILLLLAVPVLIMAVYSVPNKKRQLPASKERLHAQKRTKLHKDVYYYSAMAFLFLLLYTVTNSNLSTHLAEANLGDAAVTGVANAVMMVGGIAAGIGFGKLSSALKDHVITLSFLLIFIGFTLLNLLQDYLVADFAAVFIVGMTMSMIVPQCMFDISMRVDETNSATATMLFSSIAPGLGGFLSSVIFTNLTVLLGGESTQFRYQFVGYISLAVAVFVFVNTRRRAKRSGLSAAAETAARRQGL